MRSATLVQWLVGGACLLFAAGMIGAQRLGLMKPEALEVEEGAPVPSPPNRRVPPPRIPTEAAGTHPLALAVLEAARHERLGDVQVLDVSCEDEDGPAYCIAWGIGLVGEHPLKVLADSAPIHIYGISLGGRQRTASSFLPSLWLDEPAFFALGIWPLDGRNGGGDLGFASRARALWVAHEAGVPPTEEPASYEDAGSSR